MPFVTLRDGSRLAYDLADTTDPWRRPETVVLHHGLGKTAAYWLPWSRLLSRYFRVIAIDMLGNGRSSKPRGHAWSIASYARDVLDLLDALRLKKVHFAAEGQGGCVGLHLAARHRGRIASLALCATPYRPSEGKTANLDTRSKAIAKGGLRDFVTQTLADRADWSKLPAGAFAWFRDQRLAVSPRIYAEQMAAQHGVDLEWTLPLITAPTLLIAPGASPSAADRQMAKMARVIPNARLVELPGERQWVTFSAADDCVAEYLRFLADVTGDRSLVADRASLPRPPH